MKTYLLEFLHQCNYTAEDTAYLLAVYDLIAANETASACFLQAQEMYASDTCDYARLLTLADDAAQAVGVHEYTAELLVYLCLTPTLLKRYHEQGIEESIFWNSMLDLRYKLEECKVVKGVQGSFVAFWFEGFFNMTRFALGRLQFELVTFEGSYEKDGKHLSAGNQVINVHIPRTGTPLDPDEVEAAYREAKAFFADRIRGDIAFVCYSWLLYPDNERILTSRSNIVKFMKRYDVIRFGVDKNKGDLWRLFDTTESHPDRLPTDTFARRAYVEHIKAGGKLGWGYGVFFAD